MDLSKPLPPVVDFTRYTVPVEITFVNGQECCEWCNMSFKNNKRHFECALTGEQMFAPGDTVGNRCPLRQEESNEHI